MPPKPTKICQYMEECYRKNPIHFGEFLHPHLESIIENGKDHNGKYRIPSELFTSQDIVLIQLGILEKLFLNEETGKRKSPEISLSPKKKKTSETPGPLKEMDQERKSPETKQTPSSSQPSKSEQILPSPSSSSCLKEESLPEISTNKPKESKPTTSSNESNLDKKPKVTRNIKDYVAVVLPKGQMAEKLRAAAPYNFFLTAIVDSKPTHREPLSITLQEILDESLGEIECSLQINFMVDIGWVLGHYYFAGCLNSEILVLYGDESEDLKTISKLKPQVTAIKIPMPPFSTHHSKIMLFGYKDGSMRVVVSTANLYEDDWHNRTQGLWISPTLKPLPDDANTTDGESPTGFRLDLMAYLAQYKLAKLQTWISRIRKSDFSEVNVFFIGSCPGSFRGDGSRGHNYGHAKVARLLSQHCAKVSEKCPVVCQSSSIGSLGANVGSWIQSDLVASFSKDSASVGLRSQPAFRMIYPSFNNVKNGHDGLLSGGCLPYGKKTDEKQPWLKNYLYQWSSKVRHRSQAIPHIKSYCRWSEEGLYWFCLSSANLSKAAWGSFNKSSKLEPSLRINNYEVGVLFLPKFITGEETFPMQSDRDGVPAFPIPYDIPLTPYGYDDFPFLMDYIM